MTKTFLKICLLLCALYSCTTKKVVIEPRQPSIPQPRKLRLREVALPYHNAEITVDIDSIKGTFFYKTHHPHSEDSIVFLYYKFYKRSRFDYKYGDLKCIGSLVEGRKHGVWIEYLRYHGHSVSEKQESTIFKYITENYEEGLLHGERVVRNYKGKVVNRTTFHKGTGYYKDYYEDGNIFREGQLISGRMVGEWKFYDPIGNIRQTNVFNNKTFYPYDENMYVDTFRIVRQPPANTFVTQFGGINPCIFSEIRQGEIAFIPLSVWFPEELDGAVIQGIESYSPSYVKDWHNKTLPFPIKVKYNKPLNLHIMMESGGWPYYNHDGIQRYSNENQRISINILKNGKKGTYLVQFNFLVEMIKTEYPRRRMD